MKNKINILLLAAVSAFTSCNSYDFDKEQYKNELYLQSNGQSGGYVFDTQEADLNDETPVIKIAVGMSGSRPNSSDMKLTLVESDSLFNAFNKSNYDIDKERFAKILPRKFYNIESLETVVPAGKFQTVIPIQLIDLDKISPDSIYFLNYKIDPENSDAYNKKQYNEVLVRIHKKNDYATTKTATNYNYTSTVIIVPNSDGTAEVKHPTSTNRVFPLGKNTVRLMAGTESFGDYKKALNDINKKSIVLTVGENTSANPLAKHLKISAYKEDGVDVVQLTPIDDYDNTYLLHIISTPDGRSTYYKEFRLHYKYRLEPTENYKEVKAILRYQFNPRAEQL